MKNTLQQLISSDYEELRGLHLTGTIPVDPALLNEIIRNFLHSDSIPKAGKHPASPKSGESADLLLRLRKYLKKLEITTQGERIVVEFEIKIE